MVKKYRDKMKRNPENVALLVGEERRVVRKNDHCVKHIFREHNQEADHLGNFGAEGKSKMATGTMESSSCVLGLQQKRKTEASLVGL